MRVLAGCAGPDTDIEPSLVFAELSDAEIVRVIGAAILGDVVTAEDRIARIVGDGTDPCPTVTTAGATATITGGCTTATGIAIDGSAVVTNPLRWERGDLAPDPSGATTYDLDALTLVFPDEPWQVFDGPSDTSTPDPSSTRTSPSRETAGRCAAICAAPAGRTERPTAARTAAASSSPASAART